MRTLLSAAGERGPFVVAGHGLGAAYARMYAARPDAEVAALVLVDPPDPVARIESRMRWIMGSAPWLARVGLLRAGRVLSRRADVVGNNASGDAMRAFLNRPGHVTRSAAEFANWDDAVRLAAEATVPAEVPVTTVALDDREHIAFLRAGPDAERVVAAIQQAVQSTRASHTPQ